MAERRNPDKKLTLEETMRRIRPLFILMMFFPLTGMIAAMIIIYMIQPKNLLLIEALILLSMIFFLVTTYLVFKRMGQLRPKPASKPTG